MNEMRACAMCAQEIGDALIVAEEEEDVRAEKVCARDIRSPLRLSSQLVLSDTSRSLPCVRRPPALMLHHSCAVQIDMHMHMHMSGSCWRWEHSCEHVSAEQPPRASMCADRALALAMKYTVWCPQQ